ncbi:hypothetical protein GCM10018793_57610 [Streptomyces sulfonofaciens]|uniref:Uncharacterized protein n=1 Tax=Streptomyces sulfonofaciens TaxID=68272 RepID=A0A919GM87_9ACTN|nr:hypothetical protein GCM10018793_57610 [Streptomyces sulfonofaciens]
MVAAAGSFDPADVATTQRLLGKVRDAVAGQRRAPGPGPLPGSDRSPGDASPGPRTAPGRARGSEGPGPARGAAPGSAAP